MTIFGLWPVSRRVRVRDVCAVARRGCCSSSTAEAFRSLNACTFMFRLRPVSPLGGTVVCGRVLSRMHFWQDRVARVAWRRPNG